MNTNQPENTSQPSSFPSGEEKKRATNALINETSPYLLQHAYNPVKWYAWSDEILEKARQEDKPILISIGYSACHWCHVMEHESFEDNEVAELMNQHFICIKVDREERPDVDQIYMTAVQLMTGQGGWPLNCFALPDGRPLYGGTYFPKQRWMQILSSIAELFENEREKAMEYATQLTEGVKLAELVKVNPEPGELSTDALLTSYREWKKRFDNREGGPDRAPKFPLPNNYQFLLRLGYSSVLPSPEREALNQHIELTLTKMAYGGIYDQIGGGFSRYSVDRYWKVPHFEKMLYDNAQLVTLYSEAFQATRNPLYKQVVYDTIAFVERELTSAQGGFYSALDADSEGVEGKYYVWNKEELQQIAKDKFNIIADYYNVNHLGLWEHDNYILLRNDSDDEVANKHGITIAELNTVLAAFKTQLLEVREKRIRPGLDNKILTSWNALMTKACADAYTVFNEPHFLEIAIKNVDYLFENAVNKDKSLSHVAGKNSSGFLEDYSFLTEALLALYSCTFDEHYLQQANELMKYCLLHFQDTNSKMFYFTSDTDKALISRKTELSDNVIPASNSSIAKSLFLLSHHFENEAYMDTCRHMLNNVLPHIAAYPEGYSNWLMLLQHFTQPYHEIVIAGKSATEKRKTFHTHFLPNTLFAGSTSESSLPLLTHRFTENNTLIYVCTGKTCHQPVSETEQAIKQII